MYFSGSSRIVLRLATAAVLAFIYVPILVIVIYAFNENRTQRWPISGLARVRRDRPHRPARGRAR